MQQGVDIEADWYLLDTCNYRCDYCFSSADTLGKKLATFGTPEEWQRGFDLTGLIWLLHITGGEPSFYPAFTDLAVALTERHFISFNSNLTGPSLQVFAERVDPTRVSFINAGLHFMERERKHGAATFLRHIELLRHHAFPIFASMVATPEALERVDEIVVSLRSVGMVPVPKLLRGAYQDKVYPWDYTDLERARFRAWLQHARESCDPPMIASPTIDPFSDDDFLGGIPSYRGRVCQAGRTFVSIQKNGEVYRCGKKLRLGNILQESLSLLAREETCDTEYCFYFCEKYSTPPNALIPRVGVAAPKL